jgi:hypothetical protein
MSPHRLPSSPRRENAADIAEDARALRDRMDRTLDEIGFRLSPGQLSNALVDIARDVMRGGDGPVPRSIRANPLPVILIGAGFLWLAWEAFRAPQLEGEAVKSGEGILSPQRARILLTGLIGATRQGAARFRRVEGVIVEPLLVPPVRRGAEALDLAAEVLSGELRRRGGEPDPDPPTHPLWHAFDDAPLLAEDRERVFTALEAGMTGLIGLYRGTLKEDLPGDLRVVIGARFHDLDTVCADVSALRESVS